MPLTREQILAALRTVQDPELFKDIVTLNMVKDVQIDGSTVEVTVELTTPACPLKEVIERDVTAALKKIGAADVKLHLTASTRGPMQKRDLLPQVKNVIAVGAGKGGVGKSTLALNLAVGLQRQGAAVGIMDGDIYGPSMPTMLGIKGRDVEARGPKIVPFHVHGIHAITIGALAKGDQPLIWRGPMAHGAFKQLFSENTDWPPLDYLLVDLPPGTGDVPLTLCQLLPLTGAVIVATPQQVALDDAMRAVRMFQQLEVAILGIVENMSYLKNPDGSILDLFGRGGAEHAAQERGLPFLGALPLYMELRVNSDAGNPTANFTGNPQLRADLEHIVKNLAGQISIRNMRTPRAGVERHVTRMPNRLDQESSPYLLQHARNPVDWYPWGPEAFEASRRDHKPIFLSVGYSSCYWCHVMERQCFENDQIAQEMNQRFVNIKVDREERPDVDSLYMTAVQILTRHGGWPMSVFLTPDLRPFYGGTYFPPTDQHGRPGFPTVLRAIDDAFHNRPQDVRQASDQLLLMLQNLAEPAGPSAKVTFDKPLLLELLERSTADYDPHHGGFGAAPKFPRQTLLDLILAYNFHFPDDRRLAMLRRTLDALADGGIHDQLGGAFHRYSTDAAWLVPHFEIMLYDNAMLAGIYIEAYRQTEDRRYAVVARGILDFILRHMTSPDGVFFSAFDAEVDAVEGQTYLWTPQEIAAVLGPGATLFNDVYGLSLGPNFADPHQGSGQPEKNILYLPEPLAQVAARLSMTADQLETLLAPMRAALYAARLKRKQPFLDTKIITSWNALTIRALAYAAQILQEPRYLDAAQRAADFLLTHHRTPDGALLRTTPRPDSSLPRLLACSPAHLLSGPKAPRPGFLDDYAFLAHACLALADAGADPHWKDAALDLSVVMLDKFSDPASGGFYFTDKDASDLIVRQKIATDSPLPSGNAIAARVLLALGQSAETRRTLAAFAGPLEQLAESMSSMLQTAVAYLQRESPFTVEPSSDPTDRVSSPAELARRVVHVQAEWASPSELRLHLAILDGFHLNAHDPPPGMIATEVRPPGAVIQYPPDTEPYAGNVTIVLRFDRPVRPEPPHATLTYQPCDARACLPAVTLTLEIPPIPQF